MSGVDVAEPRMAEDSSAAVVAETADVQQRSVFAGPHFEVLDGLRGVAALCVFFYHSGNHAYAANGFLAVDFFFMLSGFVVAHSYRDRLMSGRMTVGEFVRRRIARLYPMVLLGVALGAAVLFAHNVASPAEAYPAADMAAWIGRGLLVLPDLDTNPFLNAVFPVNVVLWSLFLELLANLAYAVFVRRLSVPLLVLLALGGLGAVWWSGHVDGGGSIETFGTGFARVTAGFCVGLLIFELRRVAFRGTMGMGLWGAAAALVVLTFLPRITATAWLPLIYALFAAIIVLALDAPSMGRRTLWWCRLLGLISYPIYLIHRPLTSLVVGFGKLAVPLTDASYPWFVAVALVLSVMSSVVAVRVYEAPMRRMLGRWLVGGSRPARGAVSHPAG